MTYTDISRIDLNLNQLLNKLDFYKDDLDILSNRLKEVANKNTGPEASKGVEHFQNQFDIQRQNISDLQHRIRSSIHNCAEDVKNHNGKVSTTVSENIHALDTEVKDFEKNVEQLRDDYKKFLVKWM